MDKKIILQNKHKEYERKLDIAEEKQTQQESKHQAAIEQLLSKYTSVQDYLVGLNDLYLDKIRYSKN